MQSERHDDDSQTRRYYEYLKNTRSNKIPVFSAKLRKTDKDVAVLLMMDPSLSNSANAKMRKRIEKAAKSEWKCNTCCDRISTAARYVVADGKSPVCSVISDRNELQTKLSMWCTSEVEGYLEKTKGI
ncbi:hypothetical protein KA005_33950, partial [bacterium]|nr:hypothetical protein [bacterium]